MKSLKNITGKFVKDNYNWLKNEQCGCKYQPFASNDKFQYSVCMGWHDDGEKWVIAWKIGRQTHNNCMQTDLDVDFEMPYNSETGDVDDTETVFETEPKTMKVWNKIATEMRKTARRVWKDWKDEAND